MEDRKIAALGVQISGGIATHGLALNVSTDLGHFKNIVPCGLPKAPVTSIEKELDHPVSTERVVSALRESFLDVFAYSRVAEVCPMKLTRAYDPQQLLRVLKEAGESLS